jgi:hypothetical protein
MVEKRFFYINFRVLYFFFPVLYRVAKSGPGFRNTGFTPGSEISGPDFEWGYDTPYIIFFMGYLCV